MPRKPAKKATTVVPRHQEGRKAMKHTFSLYPSTMAQLEAVRAKYGLRSKSAAIGFLAADFEERKKSETTP